MTGFETVLVPVLGSFFEPLFSATAATFPAAAAAAAAVDFDAVVLELVLLLVSVEDTPIPIPIPILKTPSLLVPVKPTPPREASEAEVGGPDFTAVVPVTAAVVLETAAAVDAEATLVLPREAPGRPRPAGAASVCAAAFVLLVALLTAAFCCRNWRSFLCIGSLVLLMSRSVMVDAAAATDFPRELLVGACRQRHSTEGKHREDHPAETLRRECLVVTFLSASSCFASQDTCGANPWEHVCVCVLIISTESNLSYETSTSCHTATCKDLPYCDE